VVVTGVGGQFCFVSDTSGNVGYTTSFTHDVGIPEDNFGKTVPAWRRFVSGSITTGLLVSNADTIYDLGGEGYSVGAGVPIGGGVVVTGNVSITEDSTGESDITTYVGFGPGTGVTGGYSWGRTTVHTIHRFE
jgi:hypothetical protein